MSAVRPSRRRGRLTEQQEAAAQELRTLREGGGRRTDAVEVSASAVATLADRALAPPPTHTTTT